MDVYVARKRNKLGKIFGFVRFTDVKNEKWLEEQFNEIWFGSYKAWVNISRFQRKNSRPSLMVHHIDEEHRKSSIQEGHVRIH